MARNNSVYRQTIRELEALKDKSELVIKRLMADARTRVPGWVASEVTKVYNIKREEITPSKIKKDGTKTEPIGGIKVTGETIDGMQIVYTGHVVTPAHFGMTPKIPKESYTLKAEILKGKKKVLGQKKKLTKKKRAKMKPGSRNSQRSPIMLMYNGSKKDKGIKYIPFQRVSPDRNDIRVIRTLSLPQMVESNRTSEAIDRAIYEGMQKRMAQHLKILER